VIKVGITGNIGSGKSTICNIFKILGIPVFHADKEAKEFYYDNNNIHLLENQLNKCLTKDGQPDLQEIARIAFNDPSVLDLLNRHIHPFVRERYIHWLGENTSSAYSLYEAAILHESGQYKNLDKIILVKAPEDLRIKRIMMRDNVTEDDVRSRIKNQWDESDKVNLSDYIITNDDNEMVMPQVLRIHSQLSGKDTI